MAVTYDTSNYALTGIGGTTQSVTLTVGNNANRCLVLIGGAESTTQSITGVTFTSGSGGTWTNFRTKVGTFETVEIWRCLAPSTGSVTVQATWSASVIDRFLALYSLYDVDQTTPLANGADSTGSTTLNVTTGANDLAIVLATSASAAINSWSAGTLDHAAVNSQYWTAGRATGNPTSTVTTNGSTNAVMTGCAVQVAAAAGQPTMRRLGGTPGMISGKLFGRSWKEINSNILTPHYNFNT